MKLHGRPADRYYRSKDLDDLFCLNEESADKMAWDGSPSSTPVAGEIPCHISDNSSSLQDEDVFDIESEDPGYDIGLTDEDDVDAADRTQLWAGNAHPGQYYFSRLK